MKIIKEMKGVMGNKCNLKVKENKCRALCLIHNDFRCCQSCREIGVCKKVCGWMRKRKG
jgi:hypothetical protein